jgi:cyclic-di-AMP phosphodiesterase PgpH
MTKRKTEAGAGFGARSAAFLSSALAGKGLGRKRLAVLASSWALILAATLILSPHSPLASARQIALFDAGKVADRDVIAERDVVYVDEEATEAAIRRRENEVLPIFQVDDAVAESSLLRLSAMAAEAERMIASGEGAERISGALRASYPDVLDRGAAAAMAALPDMKGAFAAAESLLSRLMAKGVVAVPDTGLERYARGRIELRTWRKGELVTEELGLDQAITLAGWEAYVADAQGPRVNARALPSVRALVRGFIKENAFFDREASEKRLFAARAEVEPVIRRIARGERIVRRGYVVDAAQIAKLRVLQADSPGLDARSVFGVAAFLLLCYAAGTILLGRQIGNAAPKDGLFHFTAIAATIYMLIAISAIRGAGRDPGPPFTVLLPTALVAMLVAILQGQRAAVALGFALSLAILPASGMDAASSCFVFLSSLAGAVSVRKAEKRLDLVIAAVGLAAFQAFLVIVVSALSGREGSVLASILWAGANGFFCGMLALGFLPLLESVLNMPTRFRLMELSDLNGPVLKRLLTVAPGTYSHSVMTANLAESACLDIGANALLARVAAYYHDIGKMDQPEYFVENQAVTRNKHEELRPRLSAAVIRNHVKSGVERARAMRLPDEVIEVISQHHGDGLIVWFYNQASKEEGKVNPEEFSYPGTPPSSRESAVLLLADSIEAASRTLVKPTMARLEEFAGEIVADKIKQGQLSASPLTLRDLETIKKSFVRILAGHFHSRIEYPKVDLEAHEPG